MESSARTGRSHTDTLDAREKQPMPMTTTNSARASRHFCTKRNSGFHNQNGAPKNSTAR